MVDPLWLDVFELLPPCGCQIKFVNIHKDNFKYIDKYTKKVPEWPDNFNLPLPLPTPEELHSDKKTEKVPQGPGDYTFLPPSKPEELGQQSIHGA